MVQVGALSLTCLFLGGEGSPLESQPTKKDGLGHWAFE